MFKVLKQTISMNKYQFYQLEKRNTQYHYRTKINLIIEQKLILINHTIFSFLKFRVGKFFSQFWENFEEIRIWTKAEFWPLLGPPKKTSPLPVRDCKF